MMRVLKSKGMTASGLRGEPLRMAAWFAAGCCALCLGCRRDPIATPTSAAPPSPAAEPLPVTFVDVAEQVGIDFHHFIGATGDFYLPENTGAGCAWLDYDNDGDLDAFLPQGCLLNPDKGLEDALFPPQAPLPLKDRLYRNELISAGQNTGELRFTDVTEQAGCGDIGFAMGVTTGDYDNDGDADLFVTNFGPDTFYRNNGDGTFTDVTLQAGGGGDLADPRWNTGAVFFDYDRDGWLDLFVVGYAHLNVRANPQCFTPAGIRDYCGPDAFPAIPSRLYRNNADGTFADVTTAAGLDTAFGHGFGVVSHDFDGNGWLDLYVANDGDPNLLWLNDKGRFREAGVLSGSAYNSDGESEAGMGVALADPDDDGDADLLVTNLIGETVTLYECQTAAFFEDTTARRGLALPTRPYTAFGVGFFDADHDADLDLFIANGDVRFIHRETRPPGPYPYDQPNQFLLNDGQGRYRDATAQAGPGLAYSEVSRGVAFGDADNDGDIDLLVHNNNGPARLLRNDLRRPGNWLLLRVIDGARRRDAHGATVRARLSDGRIMTRYVGVEGSYLCANDPRVHLAWPDDLSITSLDVTTFDGRVQEVAIPAAKTFATITIEASVKP